MALNLQALQRALILRRFDGKPRLRQPLIEATDGRGSEGAPWSSPLRAVVDNVASEAEVNLLRGSASRAFLSLGFDATAADASLPPLAPAVAEDDFLGPCAALLAARLASRVALQAASLGFTAGNGDAPAENLTVANALLARLGPPSPGAVAANPLGASTGGDHGYWAPHVDKANVQ
ncbi:unnamed protein product, partial [Polarella glacialis]